MSSSLLTTHQPALLIQAEEEIVRKEPEQAAFGAGVPRHGIAAMGKGSCLRVFNFPLYFLHFFRMPGFFRSVGRQHLDMNHRRRSESARLAFEYSGIRQSGCLNRPGNMRPESRGDHPGKAGWFHALTGPDLRHMQDRLERVNHHGRFVL